MSRARQRSIEDVYPLSPLQSGLLFHSLSAPESGMYLEQLRCTLAGDLDVEAFRRAWQRVVDRHPILRTAFLWERRSKPLQFVCARVELPWEEQDWRDLPTEEQDSRLNAFLAEDRVRGFDPGKAPLMRLALLRVANDAWRLVWSYHHILLDGWSLPLLLKEVMLLYEGGIHGQEILLEPPRPYRDFIAWVQKQDRAEIESFWRRTLHGFRASTPLVVDRSPSRDVGGPAGDVAEQEIKLSPSATKALEQLARARQLTLSTLVQAMWALLLSRYSGEDDVLFGTTISGRSAPIAGIESMLGLFINTVPVRVRVEPQQSALPWLGNLHRQFAELRQYEASSLVDVQGWSDVPRGQPLFESLVVFENYPVARSLPYRGGRLNAEDVRIHERTNFPLTIAVVPGPELTLRILHDSERFSGASIGRMLGHLQQLLISLPATPDARVADLPLLTAAERRRVLHDCAAPGKCYPAETCLHQLFEAQVERAPLSLALTWEGQSLTYQALNARANRLAHHLRVLGVGPETVVGLCLERSFDLVAAILAVLKAGGGYLPLDPAYPAEHLRFLVDDACVSVLLTQQGLLDRLPPSRATVLCLDDPAVPLAGSSEANPLTGVTPANLAYLIYTSGSTGRPKGVLISHANVARLLAATRAWVQFGPEDVWALFHSYAFDFSVWEFWGALAHGGRLVVVPEWLRRSPEDFYRLLAREHVTVLNQTPSGFRQLQAAEAASTSAAPSLALRLVIFGGEALDVSLLGPWLERHGAERPRLVNMYGITETTVHVTYQPVTAAAVASGDGGIGVPIPDLCVYVVDSRLEPVPVGVPGELYVGGAGLARGYWRRPDLTAERFVPDPFSDASAARLYRTGDLGRWREDGTLEYLGRQDAQVKIRGYRIEPGEIEVVLAEHPAVAQAVVAVQPAPSGEKRLVAYVVPRDGAAVSAAEFRRHGQSRLPEHMVPAVWVLLKALPLTPSGKVDRRSLPDPASERPESAEPFQAPRTEEEHLLARIWAEVLGVQRVGAGDNFVQLGGDSILTLQVVARARKVGLSLTPQQLFQYPTIAELAAVVGRGPSAQAEQGPVTGPVPLTPIQHWFFEQQFAEPRHFNQALLLTVRTPLEPGRLEQAVRHVLTQHDALRLRFVRTDAGWAQLNAVDQEVPAGIFEAFDLSGSPEDEQRGALEATAARLQGSLDLQSGPLLRVAWFRLGETSGRLLLLIHHLAVDGVSWPILLEDLFIGYQQLSRGQALQLPPKTTSFKQWAAQLSAYARSDALAAEVPHWLEVLSRPAAALPVDYPGGDNTASSAATVEVALTAEETQALLQEVPAAYRTQITDVLLTALTQALASWTGQDALLVDVEGHGREALFADVDLSRSVGWFTSLYPVRLQLPPDPAPGPALRSIKEQLRSVPGGGLGYGVLRYLHPDEAVRRRLAGEATAGVSFNYLGQLDRALPDSAPFALAAESSGPPQSDRNQRPHALDINGGVHQGRLQLAWTFSRSLHERSTIERVADEFLEALRGLIAHCQAPDAGGFTPSDFSLAESDQATLNRLLGSGRGVEDVYPVSHLQSGLLFHSLYAPDSGAYFEQVRGTLEGQLDVPAFRQAWQRVMDRHAVLRTSFAWENLRKPLQLVHRRVPVPWQEQDWRGWSPDEQQERLDAFLKADLLRGFEFDKAPLMRMALIRVADETWHFVWSHHHLLLDGWSLPLLMKEVLLFYEGLTRGRQIPLERPYPYRDFIAWLERQDLTPIEAFWRKTLQGFHAATPLLAERPAGLAPDEPERYAGQQVLLSPSATAAVVHLAHGHHVTLNTLVLGAWALLLSRYSGQEDIVFGTTVSGRSAPLPGIESMLGLFINALPVRVRVRPEESVRSWLRQLQEQLVELRQYESSPLAQVQKWSGLPRGRPLFESLLVFENYPVDRSLRLQSGRVKVKDVSLLERTNYPLVLVVVPGAELLLRMGYECSRFAAATVGRALEYLRTLLEDMAAASDTRLSELAPLIAAAPPPSPVDGQVSEEKRRPQMLYAPGERAPDAPAGARVERAAPPVAVPERSPSAGASVIEIRVRRKSDGRTGTLRLKPTEPVPPEYEVLR